MSKVEEVMKDIGAASEEVSVVRKLINYLEETFVGDEIVAGKDIEVEDPVGAAIVSEEILHKVIEALRDWEETLDTKIEGLKKGKVTDGTAKRKK